MEEEIVKSESIEGNIKIKAVKKPANKVKAREAVEQPTEGETTVARKDTTKVGTKAVDKNSKPCVAKTEEPVEDERGLAELCNPCEPYDFRLQGDERDALLKDVKLDALELKKELVASRFNTLSLRQIGKGKRMFALRHGNDVRVYVNAAISGRAGGAVVEQIEECAPEKKYVVLRPQQIRLVFINEVGEPKETVLEGLAAAEAAKQVEREEGVFVWDIGKECPRWDKMTEPSRLRFISEYIQELAAKADDHSVSTGQEEYIKQKETLKNELKSAKKVQEKAVRLRAREISKLQQNMEHKKPWEE